MLVVCAFYRHISYSGQQNCVFRSELKNFLSVETCTPRGIKLLKKNTILNGIAVAENTFQRIVLYYRDINSLSTHFSFVQLKRVLKMLRAKS